MPKRMRGMYKVQGMRGMYMQGMYKEMVEPDNAVLYTPPDQNIKK